MLFKGDLHIHTTASDGILTPTSVVVTAKKTGIDTIAITDHNSIKGINEAAAAGRTYGVSVIPGVELSTKYNGESIHILGYFRDYRYLNPVFSNILYYNKNHQQKKARNLMKSFMPINNHGGGHLSVLEGIYLLRAFNAAVVLAHPIRINSRYIREILTLPFDGLEAKYCRNPNNATIYFINEALSRFSFYTAGSDFHTNKGKLINHCMIGNPFLNHSEILSFLSNSGAALLS